MAVAARHSSFRGAVMPLRALMRGARGLVAASLAYPVAEWLEKRDVRSRTTWILAEMARPFAERRQRAQARLVDLLILSGAEVPYYRDLFAATGFDPARVASDIRYLGDLPYLTKDIIREQGERLWREDREGLRLHACKTGGSTGPSTVVMLDQEAADWSSAVTRAARQSAGKRHWQAELHHASRFPEAFPLRDRLREHAKCFVMNRSNVFTDRIDPDALEETWQHIRRVRPVMFHAHPSTADQLAVHVEQTRGQDHAFAIFESSGELLQPTQRERIARVLQCRVIDRYGLAEAGIVAYETAGAAAGMRFFEFAAWPEIRPDPAAEGLGGRDEGEAGELVITPLFNRFMPLIRYRTGDLAVLAESGDGFQLPRMVGRVHDVVTLGGQTLPTHFIQDVLDRIGGVREFQIDARAEKPIIRIVPEADADCETLKCHITQWWGADLAVEFIGPQDLILQGHRQKFRYLVSSPAQSAGAAP